MERQQRQRWLISIHAPPRGATCRGLYFCTSPYFNSRPSARGDHVQRVYQEKRRDFNSRPSARGDWRLRNPCRWRILISIHAPPRGATQPSTSPPKRASFQFTPLREGRPFLFVAVFGLSHFNSRPSARGDLCMEGRKELEHLFQFTPLREGRRSRLSSVGELKNFNSRPSARGDNLKNTQVDNSKFQFTPLREGRRLSVLWRVYPNRFQFTPLREGRLLDCSLLQPPCISIHAPPRGATRFA